MFRSDAEKIYKYAIKESLPDEAVKKALDGFEKNENGSLYLVAIGKAGWQMAKCASDILGSKIDKGIVVTKYDHSMGEIDRIEICEAGHPVPDENTINATKKALELTKSLHKNDIVLFLVSGGGSALFESPKCTLNELQKITANLLSCGATIEEINTIRKHLSEVKGGRFAEHCRPAAVYTVILSDVLGDRLDTIASGPSVSDMSTSDEALKIIEKYKISVSNEIKEFLSRETPKSVDNSTYFIGGSVRNLCKSAKEIAEKLGYQAIIVTDSLTSEAYDAGKNIAKAAKEYLNAKNPTALIFGGETVVHIKGTGKGGRNQELVLSASEEISGIENIAIFSVGSDGTDGPTDAAGGYVDGKTVEILKKQGIDVKSYLANNDAYNALKMCDGLIITGPTGTNVNDVSIALVKPQ